MKIKIDIKLKSGRMIAKDTKLENVHFVNDRFVRFDCTQREGALNLKTTTLTLCKNAYKYITGFTKPPSIKTMEKWMDEGIAKTVTGKKTEPDGHGEDGSPSWLSVLGLI